MAKKTASKKGKAFIVKQKDLEKVFGKDILNNVNSYVNACSCSKCGKC